MLSFLVPAYNCEGTVAATVESALAQRIDVQTEVVVVDDGSKDDTHGTLRTLSARHPSIKVHRHSENRGGGPARNTAAANADGDLLYMLDSDNLLPDNCVQAQLNELRRRGADAASVGTVQYFDSGTGEHRHCWDLANDDGWATLRHAFETFKVPASHGNYLFTRDAFERVGGYEPDFGAMDTWSFGYKQLIHGFDVAVTPGVHYLHAVGHESYWTREEKEGTNDRNALRMVHRHREGLPDDLRVKVELLDQDQPFFAMVDSGGFQSSVAAADFERRLEEIGSTRRPATARRLRERLRGRLLRRP